MHTTMIVKLQDGLGPSRNSPKCLSILTEVRAQIVSRLAAVLTRSCIFTLPTWCLEIVGKKCNDKSVGTMVLFMQPMIFKDLRRFFSVPTN
jgi:hypothetical protein